jgi:hypothetical protein
MEGRKSTNSLRRQPYKYQTRRSIWTSLRTTFRISKAIKKRVRQQHLHEREGKLKKSWRGICRIKDKKLVGIKQTHWEHARKGAQREITWSIYTSNMMKRTPILRGLPLQLKKILSLK